MSSLAAKSMNLEQAVGNPVLSTSNVGGDIGLALALVGNDAPFRGLTEGANITLTVLGDSSLEIAVAGLIPSPLTTKGDLIGYDTDINRIPVGTDGQVLISDSSEALGVKWTNNLFNMESVTMVETTNPATPAADEAVFWLDPSVIINDHPRLALKDENGVNFDLSAAGILVNTFNTEAIGNNHYLAISGLNTSNGTFINRAVVMPRSCRFYNMYVVVTTNGTTVDVTCSLVEAADTPTVLEVDIPLGTTGTFFDADNFVDLNITTNIAYQFSATTGGTLAVASAGMAHDILRLESV